MPYRNDGRPGGPLPAPGPDTPSWALALIERMDRFLQVAEEDRRRAEEDRHRSDRQIDRMAGLLTRTFRYHHESIALQRESVKLQRDNNLLLRDLLKAVRGWGNGRANSGGNSHPRNRH